MRIKFPVFAAMLLIGSITLCPLSAMAADDSAPAAPEKKMSQKETDIRKLLEVSGSSKLGQQILDQMIGQFRKSMPDVPQEFWTKFQEQAQMDELVELIIPIYDKHFSDDDIKDLIKFYESPIGRKLMHEMPEIVQESMAIGQNWGRNMAQRVMQQLHEKGYVKS
jgi:hypothetical protein